NRSNPNLPSAWGRSLAYQDTSGAPRFIGPDFLVTGAIIHSADNVVLAYSTASREFLVVYNRGYDIRGRRFDINGSLLGSEIAIGVTGDYEMQPNITYNPNTGEYLVVWKWSSDPILAGTIQARRVKAGTDSTVGGTIDVDGATGADFAVPTCAFDPGSGRYLIAWYRFIGMFANVGRLMNADGSFASDRFTLSSTGQYVDLDVDFSTRMGTFFARSEE